MEIGEYPREPLEHIRAPLYLVYYPGNRPYLGTLYESRDAALHAKRCFEVVIELRFTAGDVSA